MRSMVFASLGLAAGIVLAQAASAESVQPRPQDPAPTPPQSSPSTEGRSSAPQAPIGHRQPTPRDLPPDVLRRQELGEPSPAVPRIVQPPSICRNC
jgi:hypothetical protein